MEAGQNSNAARVAQTVWPWRTAEKPAAKNGQRTRVAIEFAIATAAGLVVLLVLGKPWLGAFVLTLASLTLVGGFLIPPLYRGLRRFGALLGAGAGIVVSWFLLVPLFYLFFATGHAFLALRGKDPLHRAYDANLKSYWTERKRKDDPASYTLQY
jgi:hypothetical protein